MFFQKRCIVDVRLVSKYASVLCQSYRKLQAHSWQTSVISDPIFLFFFGTTSTRNKAKLFQVRINKFVIMMYYRSKRVTVRRYDGNTTKVTNFSSMVQLQNNVATSTTVMHKSKSMSQRLHELERDGNVFQKVITTLRKDSSVGTLLVLSQFYNEFLNWETSLLCSY